MWQVHHAMLQYEMGTGIPQGDAIFGPIHILVTMQRQVISNSGEKKQDSTAPF